LHSLRSGHFQKTNPKGEILAIIILMTEVLQEYVLLVSFKPRVVRHILRDKLCLRELLNKISLLAPLAIQGVAQTLSFLATLPKGFHLCQIQAFPLAAFISGAFVQEEKEFNFTMPAQTDINDGKRVSFFVAEDDLGVMLSILLHAKFNSDVRIDFCLSPALNKLIREVIAKGKKRRHDSPWFSEGDLFVVDNNDIIDKRSIFFKIYEKLTFQYNEEEIDSAFQKAIYPYILKN
jgi:hypothetical protein